jgi:hypothetical protein
VYDPEVQELLDSTYLGHTGNEPDPGEPAVVLQKYLEQNAHGYQDEVGRQEQKLDGELAVWEVLIQQYPQSRHALVGAAKLQRLKAIVSRDSSYRRKAADSYTRAAELGLQHGHSRYTRELSELLVELRDKNTLDQVFGKFLNQPKDTDQGSYYLVLVDYADGLARLDDERAWGYFEQALDLQPESNESAVNYYVNHLIEHGQADKAVTVLETRTTPEMRIRSGVQARLRKQALELAKRDVSEAEAEVSQVNERLSGQSLSGYSPFQTPSTESSDSTIQALVSNGTVVPSNLFVLQTNNTIWESQLYSNDSATAPYFQFPGGAKKVTLLRFPDVGTQKNRGGAAIVGTDNAVYYQYYNGSSWGGWQNLGGSASDVAAVVYPNGQADIFRVDVDNCNIYNRHSSDRVTWTNWAWWGACGDQLTVAAMPNGTAWAAMRATQAGNQAVVRYFNGSTWAGSWTSLGGVVNDLALTAYPNPSATTKTTLWAVGSDNCTVSFQNWNGTSWTNWTSWASCYKNVSSFTTIGDNGAFLLFIGSDTQLYTERFDGTNWYGILPQYSTAWSAVAGADFTDRPAQPPYVHNINSDDCRTQNQTCYPDPGNPGACFRAQTINLAEIIYNEARAELWGAQALVGWTVRDRAYQSLSCDSYKGAEGGGAVTNTCRATLPCNDPLFCDSSKRYCCVMHGGTTTFGVSQSQFNDGHVDFNTLYNQNFLYLAVYILNGLIPDPATGFVPPGVTGCGSTTTCDSATLFCSVRTNTTSPDPHGPHEYLNKIYDAKAFTCRNRIGFTQCAGGGPGDNYFWGHPERRSSDVVPLHLLASYLC